MTTSNGAELPNLPPQEREKWFMHTITSKIHDTMAMTMMKALMMVRTAMMILLMLLLVMVVLVMRWQVQW